MKKRLTLAAAALCLASCQTLPATDSSPSSEDIIAFNKELGAEFVKTALIDFDVWKSAHLMTERYEQHNPDVPDRAAGILGFLPKLEAVDMQLTTHRMFADEEYFVSHNQIHNTTIPGVTDVLTFDIWRIVDGRVDEHWDNVALLAKQPNPSGRTQLDGWTDVVDIEKTEENKALVLDFVDTVLIGGDVSKIADYISAETFWQHNTELGDGIDTMANWLEATDENGKIVQFDKLHFSVTEGNFTITLAEGTYAGKPTAYFNLFRVDDGKIVEHWDIIEQIPPASDPRWMHSNGKF